MLTRFPDDIIRLVLQEYLEITQHGLSKLDCAYCNRKTRGDLLTTLAITRTPTQRDVKTLGNYLNWIVLRSVAVEELQINPHTVSPAVEHVGWAWTEMPQITSISFAEPDIMPYFIVTGTKFAPFFLRFPNLRQLNCSGWTRIDNPCLRQFQSLQCPLEVINLSGCYRISGMVVAKLVAAVGSTLRSLRCEVLDNKALFALTGACDSIRELFLSTELMTRRSAIVQFCVSNGYCLQTLHLLRPRATRPKMLFSAQHMLAITATCTNLKSFIFELPIDPQDITLCLQHIRDHCPLVSHIHLQSLSVDLATARVSLEPVAAQYAEEILTVFKHPVHEFSCKSGVKTGLLHQLLSSHGKDFRSLDIGTKDINDMELLICFGLCQHLTALTLSHCAISDINLMQLPKYCPHLTSLSFFSCSHLTDIGACALLVAYQHAPMQQLSFRHCRVTDVTAEKIAELFPTLAVLDLSETKVTMHTLFTLISAHKLRVGTLLVNYPPALKEFFKRAGTGTATVITAAYERHPTPI